VVLARTSGNLDRLHPGVGNTAHPVARDLQEPRLGWHLEPGCHTLFGRERAGEHGLAGVVLDVLEKECRAFALLVNLGDVTKLKVPVHLLCHPMKLTVTLQSRDELSKIAIRHNVFLIPCDLSFM